MCVCTRSFVLLAGWLTGWLGGYTSGEHTRRGWVVTIRLPQTNIHTHTPIHTYTHTPGLSHAQHIPWDNSVRLWTNPPPEALDAMSEVRDFFDRTLAGGKTKKKGDGKTKEKRGK